MLSRLRTPLRLGVKNLCRVGLLATMAAVAAGAACAAGGTRNVVLLDCYFNNEWRKNPGGERVRYHYVWSDTTNSGYSQWAAIIEGAGCKIDTLCVPPTAEALRQTWVYMIVDPDTRDETDCPHYIDDETIETVTGWVKSGGVLILFGNDKGNAEFEHLNRLASGFGIRFNEDSRNRVSGKDFGAGTLDSLPDHPLFAGVRKIFIKELSTLQVREPAHVVLSQGGDTIMAFARFGSGCVFAVGDPWFYNEYMDTRKLPAGYDNARAAENLVRWLLHECPGQ